MSNIRLSIVIPTYNRGHIFDQTLQSVAYQTKKPYEVLIVDDASTDETPEIIQKYVKKYGWRYIRNEKNVGMMENWNLCIKHATGDYLSFLHDDDLMSDEWYEEWTETISKHKAPLYTSVLGVIDDYNNPKFVAHTFNQDTMIKQPHVLREFWYRLSPAIPPTAVNIYERKVFKETAFFEPGLATEADVLVFLKLFAKYDVFFKNKVLCVYRSHKKQGMDPGEKQKSLKTELKRLDNYFGILTNFYKKELGGKPSDRFFIQIPYFMTITPINLYIIKFQFERILNYYKIARKHFPSLFTHWSDWYWFFRIQLRFVQRALLLDRLLCKEDQEEIAWLKKIH